MDGSSSVTARLSCFVSLKTCPLVNILPFISTGTFTTRRASHFSPVRPLRCLFWPFSSQDWIAATCTWQVLPCLLSGSWDMIQSECTSPTSPHCSVYSTLTRIIFKNTDTCLQSWKWTDKAKKWYLSSPLYPVPLEPQVWLDLSPYPSQYKAEIHQDSSLYWHLHNIRKRSHRYFFLAFVISGLDYCSSRQPWIQLCFMFPLTHQHSSNCPASFQIHLCVGFPQSHKHGLTWPLIPQGIKKTCIKTSLCSGTFTTSERGSSDAFSPFVISWLDYCNSHQPSHTWRHLSNPPPLHVPFEPPAPLHLTRHLSNPALYHVPLEPQSQLDLTLLSGTSQTFIRTLLCPGTQMMECISPWLSSVQFNHWMSLNEDWRPTSSLQHLTYSGERLPVLTSRY